MKYPRYGWFLISIIVGQTHDIFQPLPRLRLVAARGRLLDERHNPPWCYPPNHPFFGGTYSTDSIINHHKPSIFGYLYFRNIRTPPPMVQKKIGLWHGPSTRCIDPPGRMAAIFAPLKEAGIPRSMVFVGWVFRWTVNGSEAVLVSHGNFFVGCMSPIGFCTGQSWVLQNSKTWDGLRSLTWLEFGVPLIQETNP